MTGGQTDGRTAGRVVGCHPEGAYATEGAETAALRVTTVRLSARPADYHA
jgi:hypothetical protein